MPTDILQLIALNPGFKTYYSDRPYYDLYNYCLFFQLDNLSTLRNPRGTLEELQREIKKRFESRRASLLRFGYRSVKNLGGSWRDPRQAEEDFMSERDLNPLLRFAEDLAPKMGSFKLVIFGNHGYLYSNDPEFLRATYQKDYIDALELRQIAVNRQRGVISLQNPKHTARSYFRERYITHDEDVYLHNFLRDREDFRLSPALKEWVNRAPIPAGSRHRAYTQRHWFVDHDDAGLGIMLELVCPNIIRRTVPIVRLNS